jgi:esterase
MELHFQPIGEGPPLILLHGLLGSLQNWHSVAGQLAKGGFQVFSLDLRNHGHSPHSARMDLFLMADDVHEFIQNHKVANAVLIGHSLGGKVAMTTALRHPALIRAVVSVDIGIRAYGPRHDDIFQALSGLDLSRFTTREGMDAALATRLNDKRLRQFLLTNAVRQSSGTFIWRMNLASLRDNYALLSQGIPALPPYPGPALFVRGGKSEYLKNEELPEIQKLFPVARMITIEESGHWVVADQPEAFIRILLDFLGSIQARIPPSEDVNKS